MRKASSEPRGGYEIPKPLQELWEADARFELSEEGLVFLLQQAASASRAASFRPPGGKIVKDEYAQPLAAMGAPSGTQDKAYAVWSDEEDDILRKVYPVLSPDELKRLFPNRSPSSIARRAFRLGLKKTEEYISAKQGANASKLGIAHFADHPVEALAQKYPDLKRAYDSLVEVLLAHPAVDSNNAVVVEMLKEAALHKCMQAILMRDRIEKGLKGRQLIVNPRTGNETWVETRYPHGPDIVGDAKLARQILRDLGIIKEPEQKVEVLANLKFLWEDDEEDGE